MILLIYNQSKTIRKVIEAFSLTGLNAAAIFYFSENLPALGLFVWPVAIVLISLRYGIYPGFIPFSGAVITTLFYEVNQGGDLYLFFTNFESILTLLLYFFLLLFTGLSRNSQQERYSDLTTLYQEASEEKRQLKEALEDALEVNRLYRKRFLESEDAFSEMYDMVTALNFTDSDTIFNELVRIVQLRFRSSQLVLYYISSQGHSIRSKINTNKVGSLKSNYRGEDVPGLISKVMNHSPRVLFKSADEADDSPMIAGPVFVVGEMRYVMALNGVKLESCTAHHIQWLDWCLKWAGNRLSFAYKYEQEKNHLERYEGTGIYKLASFFRKFNAELERVEKIGQPFVIFEIHTPGLSIGEIDLTVKNQLRELDSAGWDEETDILYVLLPGVEPAFEASVKARLQNALRKEAAPVK